MLSRSLPLSVNEPLLTRCLVTLVRRHTTVAISRIHQQRVRVLALHQLGYQTDLSGSGVHAEDITLLTVRVEEILNLRGRTKQNRFRYISDWAKMDILHGTNSTFGATHRTFSSQLPMGTKPFLSFLAKLFLNVMGKARNKI